MENTIFAQEAEIKKLKEEIQQLKKNKKYGLVWEETKEKLDDKNIIPLVKEKKELHILTNPNKDMNYLIEGDNYHSLLALQKTHLGKIDVIYIDPPYNTGNEFVYNDKIVDKEDNFRHSKWLSFMHKRLKLAKSLLSEDGVIFVSIDDNEQAQLKLLMDEVFGEANFVGNLFWKSFHSVKNDARNISKNVEFILVYAKNKKSKKNVIANEKFDKSDYYKLDDNDGRGKYKLDPAYVKSRNSSYTILFPDGREWTAPKGTFPRYSKEKFIEMLSDNRILWKPDAKNPSVKRYLSEVSFGRKLSSLLNSEDVGYTMTGDKQVKEIIGKVFQNPKPTNLIKKLIEVTASKNSYILDFFAGSGTTGHAVMELNKEDGGNRKFILCTNNEVSEEKVRQHFINQGLLDKNTKTAFKKFYEENKELVNEFYETEDYQKLGIARSVTYERLKRVIEGYVTPKGKSIEGLTNNNLIYLQTTELIKNTSPNKKEQYTNNKGKEVSLATETLDLAKLKYQSKHNRNVLPIHDLAELPFIEYICDTNEYVLLTDIAKEKEVTYTGSYLEKYYGAKGIDVKVVHVTEFL